MGSRSTDRYIEEAKLFLKELVGVLKTKEFLTIDELSRELEKNRNFVSAFLAACVAFDICDVKVTNSKTFSLKEKLKADFDPNRYKLAPVPIREE